MRSLLALIWITLYLPTTVVAQPISAAIRTDRWTEAEALAATEPDPLAAQLVLYYRLLAPNGARAVEIAAFMAQHPDWPNQALLSRRLQEALAVDKDEPAVLTICKQQLPRTVPSLLHCADVQSRADLPTADAARRAWITSPVDASSEAAFMRKWAGQITPNDQWARFDRLAWTESSAPNGPAARQVLRLPSVQRPAAQARLALRRDEPTAPARVQALPEAARAGPTLVLELARWYRRAGQDTDAARVWTGPGIAAEQAAPLDRSGAFWVERNLLSRRLLRNNEAALSYAVAAAPAATRGGEIDQAFLAGWIALRKLERPSDAMRHFNRLRSLSPAAITQARAHYWLGRAHAAVNDTEAARASYVQAARWPTTYYGQIAALALTDGAATLTQRITSLQDPGWDTGKALAFLTRENARVAVLLTSWGEPRRAKAFLQRLDDLAENAVDRALAANLALKLGLPEQAVAIARSAGSNGVMLPVAGWPTMMPLEAPVEQAVMLGLIRQESSFDAQAASPAGARGLSQLMPATATAVARRLGVPPNIEALTSDPDYNVRLGATYLSDLLIQFKQALPLAIAGYNAGPSRVIDWLVGYPDLAWTAIEMIDWIEMIPFNETRNYVQRVIENIAVYRARLGIVAPYPLAAPGK